MENNTHKEIKVYGTLLNLTINTNPNGTQSDLVDNTHNDYLTVAYQLYDERFSPKKGSGANFAVTAIDRYQDIINKRLTAIYFDDLNTQDGGDDITYIDSKVNIGGDTNIEKNLTVEGDATFEGDINITGDINLDMGLNDLNDVTLSTMAVGQVLRYDGSGWVNAKLSINDLEMPVATAGLVLKFNGNKWVAGTDNVGLQGATTLEDLTDVDITNKSNGDVLTYDSNSGKWKATTSSFAGITTFEADVTNTYGPYSTGNGRLFYYLMSELDAKKVINVVAKFSYTYNNSPIMNDGSLIVIYPNVHWLDKNLDVNIQNIPDNCWYFAGVSNSNGTTVNSVKFIFYILN